MQCLGTETDEKAKFYIFYFTLKFPAYFLSKNFSSVQNEAGNHNSTPSSPKVEKIVDLPKVRDLNAVNPNFADR